MFLYVYTKHALQKADALGIGKDEIETIVKKGVKWREEKRSVWHASMANTEVVFMKNNGNVVIITVYEARWEK